LPEHNELASAIIGKAAVILQAGHLMRELAGVYRA